MAYNAPYQAHGLPVQNQFNHLVYNVIEAGASPALQKHTYSDELSELLEVIETIPTHPTPDESLVNMPACLAKYHQSACLGLTICY